MTASLTEKHIIHTISPVWNTESRILILGTMPSPKSREAGFFYMHPQNRFWPVLCAVFSETLKYDNSGRSRDGSIHPAAARAERAALILHHQLALWDVLAGCDIRGADDASIRSPVPNDFTPILSASKINTIVTTGQTAHRIYMQLCFPVTGIQAVCLPSTSPANRGRWPLEELIKVYSILKKGE